MQTQGIFLYKLGATRETKAEVVDELFFQAVAEAERPSES